MMKSFENVGAAGKEAMDNGLKSAAVVMKGMQAIVAETAEYSKTSFDAGSAVMEKLFAAKSLDKAMEIQSAFVKDAWEAHVAEMTKISELYADLAKEAFKPFEAMGFKAA